MKACVIRDSVSLSSPENEKHFGQKLYSKSKHISCSIFFFISENQAICEKMLKNLVNQTGHMW